MTGRRVVLCLLAAALAAACATRPTTPVAAPGPAAPAPTERPSTPSPSVGPSPSAPSPATPPGAGAAEAPPREGAAAPAAPSAPRPAPSPGRAGRQIVLNFDNADIEAVIQAASEIAGFNYTLGPG